MRFGGPAVAALGVALAACGGSTQAAGELSPEATDSCTAYDGEGELDVAAAAHPVAIGPGGPVTGLRRELDGSALFVSDSGVCAIAETAPRTWALTSLVLNERDEPLPGAMVILEALEPVGLDVRLMTHTDDDGAFAFVNVPVVGERSCYRTRVTAPGFLPHTAVETVTPQTYAGNVFLSRDGYAEGLGTDRRACVETGPP